MATDPAVVVAVATLLLAAATGGLLVVAPRPGVALGVLTAGALWSLGRPDRAVGWFCGGLAVILTGYAFCGKGFAYLGMPPLYVGEVVLALAALTTLTRWRRARLTRLHAVLLLLMLWGAVRTAPYLTRDGIDALRDAVLWAYALFALALSLVVERRHVDWLVARYRRALPLFVLWLPLATLLWSGALTASWLPESLLSLLYVKGGDMSVHLAGGAAFTLIGLYASGRRLLTETVLWAVWLAGAGLMAALNRGGMLAIAVSLAVLLCLLPSRRWFAPAFVAVIVLASVALWNPTFDLGLNRDASLGQLAANAHSLVAPEQGPLANTVNWRLDWWRKIVDYTIFGPRFWTGKGFGVNLTIDDGVTFSADLRSPHNSHLTVLARMGVPGLALWVALQAGFGWSLLRALRRARRAGDLFWARVDAWLLAYWLAMLVNASFDVYLEGPQGGIWFWSIVGLGLAALRLQRTAAR